jgi:hypothetical protein
MPSKRRTIDTRGVYQLVVGPSVRDSSEDGAAVRYLLYNTITGVYEEECWFAPQAYNYLEQLSAEWDARHDSAELEAEEEAAGKVVSVGSLRAKSYEH